MVLAVALQAVSSGLKLLTAQLVKGVEAGFVVDEALRGLGTSFEEQAGPLTDSMQDLRGSLVDRTVPTILAMQAGLQGNAEGTKELINQQRITGTTYAKTATTFAALERIGGLQRESTNRLGSDIIDLGTQFGVTTDVLVNSLDGLKDNLIDIDLMGLPDHVVESVAHMAARMGPELAPAFEKVVDFVLSPALEDIGRREALGLHNAEEALRNTTNTAESIELWMQFIQEGNKQFKIFNTEIPGGIAAAVAAFGPNGKMFGPLAAGLTERQRKENDAVADFADSIANMKKEIFVPLQMVFMEKLTPIIQRFAEIMKGLSDKEMSKFAHFLGGAIDTLIFWVSELPGVLESVLNAFHSLVLGFKAMDWGALWSGIVGVSNAIWTEAVDQWNHIAAQLQLLGGHLHEYGLAIRLWFTELGDWWDNEPETKKMQRDLAAAQALVDPLTGALTKAVRDAKGDLGFGGTHLFGGIDPFKPLVPNEDNPSVHMARMADAFTAFKVEWDKGDAGTKLFAPIIPIWKQALGVVEQNTGKTADLMEDEMKKTSQKSVSLFEAENQASMRQILGLSLDDKLQRVLVDQLGVLVSIEENQVSEPHMPHGMRQIQEPEF